MNTSSELSDDKAFCNTMDEDILNYLSTLTPQQQKYLDDFVSISEHKIVTPMPAIDSSSCLPKFAYGNSVGANYFYGRPMSVYEPFVPPESEFSSLPPDLVSSNDPNVMYDPMNIAAKYWEAEDAEYIETLNEMQDNVGQQSTNNYDDTRLPTVMETIADIHYSEDKTNDTHIYAVVQKNRKQPENLMVASDRSASDPPREKFPKIMTQSCYGELNNPTELIWNCYEQDLVNSMENVTEDGSHQIISSLMTDSSIIDGISSMNSSIYEQIPSMTSSIEMQMTMPRSTAAINQRKIVKWWDDREYTEESTLDLHGTAEEGWLEATDNHLYLNENSKP
ncbi:CLUMA_CG018471, isoform A [Clunio marinus]|uniref:CLUMA_CG018471, isoform A n=1 Tax=Clunio marinus TaxID=568069 RepID=A0A1J1J3D1_9DIPT|nr:CLUMA_CG018471, isoform A [Clunio marinus]